MTRGPEPAQIVTDKPTTVPHKHQPKHHRLRNQPSTTTEQAYTRYHTIEHEPETPSDTANLDETKNLHTIDQSGNLTHTPLRTAQHTTV